MKIKLPKLFTRRKDRQKNPDWSRVDEPDNILPSFMYYVVGIPLTVVLMMFAYAVMTDSLAEWIAHFIAAQNSDLPLDQQIAAFTSIAILFVNLIVIFAYSLTRTPDGDDIVEMLSDLDENLQERIVELEHSFDERLARLEREYLVDIDDEDLIARVNGEKHGIP